MATGREVVYKLNIIKQHSISTMPQSQLRLYIVLRTQDFFFYVQKLEIPL